MSKLSPYSTTKKLTVQDLKDIKAKGGKITRNPFFNFVRTIRLMNPGQRQTEVIFNYLTSCLFNHYLILNRLLKLLESFGSNWIVTLN